MHRIAIVGLSLRETSPGDLERIESRFVGRDVLPRELADELGASELVVVRTCNRIEVAFAREEGPPPSPQDAETVARELGLDEGSGPRPHVAIGPEAVRYLFRVAASLESLVLGEDQILAQLRGAFAQAEQQGLTGPLLSPPFRAAFQVGKLVRTRTTLSRHPVSVASLAAQELCRRAGAPPSSACIVGAGKMARLLALSVADAGGNVRWIANRTLSRARELARDVGASAVSLEELRAGALEPDALLAATGAPDAVLSADQIARIARRRTPEAPLWCVDVAMPADLARAEERRVARIDLDSLLEMADANRRHRAEAAAEAEALIEERVRSFLSRPSDPVVSHAVGDLRASAAELYEREIRTLSNGRLATLNDEQREAAQRWLHAAFGRWSHLATDALKRLAHEVEATAGRDPRREEPS